MGSGEGPLIGAAPLALGHPPEHLLMVAAGGPIGGEAGVEIARRVARLVVELAADALDVARVVQIGEQGIEVPEQVDVDHQSGVLADRLLDLPPQGLLGLGLLGAAGKQPAIIMGTDELGAVPPDIAIKRLGQHGRNRLVEHPVAFHLVALEQEPERLPLAGAGADDVALDMAAAQVAQPDSREDQDQDRHGHLHQQSAILVDPGPFAGQAPAACRADPAAGRCGQGHRTGPAAGGWSASVRSGGIRSAAQRLVAAEVRSTRCWRRPSAPTCGRYPAGHRSSG